MSANLTLDYRNISVIRKMGIEALSKALGPVGMAYFIQQFDRGEGDYTAERKALFADVTMEDLMGELNTMRSE